MERKKDTLWSWLELHAQTSPDTPAIIGPGGSTGYGELANKVRSVAGGLQALGLKKGDVVAVQIPNIEAYVVAFLAITACGGIVQTLHMPYRQAELRHLLEHSGARMAIGLSVFKDMSPAAEMHAMSAELPALRQVIAVGEPVEGTHAFADLMSGDANGTLPELSPDDPFLLLYTSGTTASPKGVPHSYRGFLGNAARSAEQLGITADEKMLSVAPYTHLYGLFVMHMCLATGAAQALLPVFDPKSFLPTLAEVKPGGIFAAPAHFAPFCAAGLLKAEHLAHTRFTCLSGSTVPPALAEQVDDLMEQGSVIQLWGMSELQAGAFGRPDDPKQTRLTSAGRASEATELRTVDTEGQVLDAGEEGELQVRGASVFAGYLNNQAETDAAFTDGGWFRTGDLAVLDANGFLTLTGRVKEVINRGGVKYNPIDIEALLMGHEAIEACAIVPYPDPDLGERACLCVQICEGNELTLEDVTALLEEQGIAKYKWPERLEFVEAMPLTPTRKIMRGKLKQLLA
ncbi:class I adenylate-forming enzyme family protein [Hoeflea sp. TYP-13]|uniref:class I adenylate-forming enzyme family protein n=1 Tax=Hoeflea sp. TYP-13 TaxID=3230023 RepID=UPI0034C5B8AD